MYPDRIRTDEQLIEQFLTRPPDEAGPAFAALMSRHGPAVMGVRLTIPLPVMLIDPLGT